MPHMSQLLVSCMHFFAQCMLHLIECFHAPSLVASDAWMHATSSSIITVMTPINVWPMGVQFITHACSMRAWPAVNPTLPFFSAHWSDC